MDESRPFLEDNLATLSLSKSLVTALRQMAPPTANLTVEMAQSGAPILIVDGVALHDRGDPVAEAQRHVESLVSQEKVDLVVLFGLGLGYHVEQLERRYDSTIIVYDPSLDILSASLGSRLLNLKRTTVFNDLAQLADHTVGCLQFNDHRMVVGAIPPYTVLFSEQFEKFKTLVQASADNAHILENTVVYRVSTWLEHAVTNVPRVVSLPRLESIGDCFAGKPGIVVAAGPSLARNIETLRQAEGRAIVIGVNTSLPQLARGGVVPDMVAVVEGLDLTSQFDVPFLDQLVVLPALIAYPAFFDLGARHVVPFGDRSATASDWIVRAFDSHPITTGGSVACSAFSILHYLGCDPIILVGQDLAYTGGARYAPGAKFGTQKIEYDQATGTVVTVERNATLERIRADGGLDAENRLRGEEVVAYGGEGKVVTTKMFSLFRQWFESSAATWASDRTLINATEGGARIEGFEEMSLAQALSRYAQAPVPAKQWLDEKLSNVVPCEPERLIVVIDEDLEKCRRYLALANEASERAEAAVNKVEGSGVEGAKKELGILHELEVALSRIPKEFLALDHYVAAEVNHLRQGRHEDEDASPERQSINSLRRSQTLFKAVAAGAETLIQKMDEVKRKLGAPSGHVETGGHS